MDPHDDVIRIGDAERTAALEALGEHMRAGRLDPTEYSERAEAVALARTPAALAPLFADLPAPGPFVAPPRPPAGPPAATWGPPAGPPWTASTPWAARTRPWGGRAAATLVAMAPVIALVVGLATGFWLIFLLVPLTGALVWGDPKAGLRPYGRGGAYRHGRCHRGSW